MIGKTLGKYQIDSKLGQGGMGAVYRGYDQVLDRYVAIKILPETAAQNPEMIQRFEIEARAAAKLEHPNIVQVHDFGKSDGQYYLVLQFISGKSLSQLVREKGPLPLGEAVSILVEALKALQKAHSLGIVHRDIKPDNIMISQEGSVKVTDFGIAKIKNEATKLTVTGQIMGTPHYMSPEQCLGESVDGRSDLYSLGATFYYMLAGNPPFEAESALVILNMHLEKILPDIRKARPDIPEPVVELLQRMTAKDADQRFRTAEEVIEGLHNPQSMQFSRDPSLHDGATLAQAPTLGGATRSAISEAPSKPAHPSPGSSDRPFFFLLAFMAFFALALAFVLWIISWEKKKIPSPVSKKPSGKKENHPPKDPAAVIDQANPLSWLSGHIRALVRISLSHRKELPGSILREVEQQMEKYFKNLPLPSGALKQYLKSLEEVHMAISEKDAKGSLFFLEGSFPLFDKIALDRLKIHSLAGRKVVEFPYQEKPFYLFSEGRILVCTAHLPLIQKLLERSFRPGKNRFVQKDLYQRRAKKHALWAFFAKEMFSPDKAQKKRGIDMVYRLAWQKKLDFVELFREGKLCHFRVQLSGTNPFEKVSSTAEIRKKIFQAIPQKALGGSFFSLNPQQRLRDYPLEEYLYRKGETFPFWSILGDHKIWSVGNYVCPLEKAENKRLSKGAVLFFLMAPEGVLREVISQLQSQEGAVEFPSSLREKKLYMASPYLVQHQGERMVMVKLPPKALSRLKGLIQRWKWTRRNPKGRKWLNFQLEQMGDSLGHILSMEEKRTAWPGWLKDDQKIHRFFFFREKGEVFDFGMRHFPHKLELLTNREFFLKFLREFLDL